MIAFVYRPVRRIQTGKRVTSSIWRGRFSLVRGGKARSVSLDTMDKTVAEKRLHDLVIEAQREAEGIVAPAAVREAAKAALVDLLAEYKAELTGRELAARHVHDTTLRLARMVSALGWHRLADVREDRFAAWRAGLDCSAKTKKEYQVSANAFFNWLVRTGRLLTNPLAKLDRIDIRGKQVRKARAFTQEELRRLLAVAGPRRLVYLVLLYTGQRKNEVRALVWGDLHLDGDRPFALFREGTMKDKTKRAVPLHPGLIGELRAARPLLARDDQRVFAVFPTYKTLRSDFLRAEVLHKDTLGRVLHFHSFRKTFQTMGVLAGVNQRSAQELLGHSDANLTARVYTDVPALALHAEVAKLPWLGGVQSDAQKLVRPAVHEDLQGVIGRLLELAQVVARHGKTASCEAVKDGGPYWARTSDLFHVKETL